MDSSVQHGRDEMQQGRKSELCGSVGLVLGSGIHFATSAQSS